jgi:GT2 family glycosyltransferase
VLAILAEYASNNPKIKVVFRKENGNISAASNSAIQIATGDYLALLDHDDELTPDALYEVAQLIHQDPCVDFIYSDEDKIDQNGKRLDPFFKPDWSPDYFYACMYTCHLGVYRKSLIDQIGGFRSDYDGAQDYDLVLRVTEQTNNIRHIPKVLYSWRIVPTSTAMSGDAKPWAYVAAKRALEEMLRRSNYPGRVEEGERLGFFRVRRNIIGNPLVSIVIPSAGKSIEFDGKKTVLLEQCIRSIRELSSYQNIELIVVDGCDLSDGILENIKGDDLRLVRCDRPFNYSMRMNWGVKEAQGEFILCLNDDIEVISPDWIESMLQFAQQKEIGAVGAKLLFPNHKIQHNGVVVLNGNPGHVFYGYDQEHPGYFLSNIVNRNYIAVTGACLMIRKSLYEEVRGFDEFFPLNYNDVDFCLRLHQAGYRNVVTPYAQLYHYESMTREKGLQPKEWNNFNHRWREYLTSLGGDPYYSSYLSDDGNFDLKL